MANNRLKVIAFFLTFAAAFVAGGWFFSRILVGMGKNSEVLQLYNQDRTAVGIFDEIPENEQIQEWQQPGEEIVTGEQTELSVLPSQMLLTDLSEIAGIAPKEKQQDSGNSPDEVQQETQRPAVELDLTGKEVTSLGARPLPSLPAGEGSKISLIAAPVRHFVIRNTDEYKEFKRRAQGSYPTVDFAKQMLVVLESDSNLPDKVFELIAAEDKDGELLVTYRVNVFGLNEKINSHTVLAIPRTTSDVKLKQVL